MLSDEDHRYFYRRAEVELELAQRATCQPAVLAHVELAERYMALCGGMAQPIDGARPLRR